MGERVIKNVDEISENFVNALKSIKSLKFDDGGNIKKEEILRTMVNLNNCLATINVVVHEIDDLLQYVE